MWSQPTNSGHPPIDCWDSASAGIGQTRRPNLDCRELSDSPALPLSTVAAPERKLPVAGRSLVNVLWTTRLVALEGSCRLPFGATENDADRLGAERNESHGEIFGVSGCATHVFTAELFCRRDWEHSCRVALPGQVRRHNHEGVWPQWRARAVTVENLLLKQQLIVLRLGRAPEGAEPDAVGRLLCGCGSLFRSPERIRKVAIGLRPSPLLALHQSLVRREHRRPRHLNGCVPCWNGNRVRPSKAVSGRCPHLIRRSA
jgi:hypothetical protein